MDPFDLLGQSFGVLSQGAGTMQSLMKLLGGIASGSSAAGAF